MYDGADSSSPILLSVCGVDLPDAVESSGSVATVLFRTDSSVTYPGFLVEWTEVSGVLTVVPPTLPPGRKYITTWSHILKACKHKKLAKQVLQDRYLHQ